ncbi:MAG: hypothetical protein DMG61_07970 [Acidobacteria bacterium]|nr:MAG: hypothetical protein DMG61_07970 [Acidobacteriota bacterium]
MREAKFSDFKAVEELKQRGRLATDSFENWERLWRNNPAVTNAQTVYPIGWVLEAGTSIVGYLGNIVLQYRFRNRALTAATSHGLVGLSFWGHEPRFSLLSAKVGRSFPDDNSD